MQPSSPSSFPRAYFIANEIFRVAASRDFSRFRLFAERICKIDLAVDFMFYDFTNEKACERKTIYFAPTFPPVPEHKRSRRSRCTCIDVLVRAQKEEKDRVGAEERERERSGRRLRRTRFVDVFPPSRLSSTFLLATRRRLLRSPSLRFVCAPSPLLIYSSA